MQSMSRFGGSFASQTRSLKERMLANNGKFDEDPLVPDGVIEPKPYEIIHDNKHIPKHPSEPKTEKHHVTKTNDTNHKVHKTNDTNRKVPKNKRRRYRKKDDLQKEIDNLAKEYRKAGRKLKNLQKNETLNEAEKTKLEQMLHGDRAILKKQKNDLIQKRKEERSRNRT